MQDHVRTLEWKQFVAHQIQAVVNECVIVKGIAGTLKRQVIIGEDIVYLVIHVGYGLSTFSSSVSTSDEEVPSINGQRRGLSPFSFVKRICTQCKEMATIEDTLHRKNCAAAWAKVSNTALVLVGYYLSREEPQRAGLFNIAGNAIGIVPEFINFCNTEDVRDRCVAAAGMLHKVLSSVVTGAGMYVEDRRVTGVGMSLAAGQLVYMPDLLKLCMAKPTEDRTAHRQSTEPTTTVPPRLNP
ncbi:hypothetical protein MMC32_000303 [Xylographa parallela]|nr:hypothetical protein [Xylographa parallela]